LAMRIELIPSLWATRSCSSASAGSAREAVPQRMPSGRSCGDHFPDYPGRVTWLPVLLRGGRLAERASALLRRRGSHGRSKIMM
jgi:hypothetical protein